MALRLIHTADWHLGHRLRDQGREAEHQAFLQWLLDTLERDPVDALLVSGDVFDTANPSVEARAMFHRFLAGVAARKLCGTVVVTAGNHDSPAQLEITREVLEPLGIHVVGSLPEDPGRAIIPLRGRDGQVKGMVCAIPFIRSRDMKIPVADATNPLGGAAIAAQTQEAIASVYRSMAGRARTIRHEQGQDQLPLVAMGHLYADGSLATSESVRDIYVGKLGAVPVEVVDPGFDYVALGHLHQEAAVSRRPHVRYSGSPLANGFTEGAQDRFLLDIRLEDRPAPGQPCPLEVRPIRVPSPRRIIQEEGPWDEVRQRLDLVRDETPAPWIEVVIPWAQWTPSLAGTINQYARDQDLPIVSIRTGPRDASPGEIGTGGPGFENLSPAQIFQLLLDYHGIPEDERASLQERFLQVHEAFLVQDEDEA